MLLLSNYVLIKAVDSEVIEHLKRRTMALLPAPEVLEKLFQLYEHNFDENLPAHKRDWFLDVRHPNEIIYTLAHFVKVLPFEEYAYTILPPALPQPVALHIRGSIYPPPFEGLPSIRSKLHPCFVLGPAGFYVAKFRAAFGVNPFDESTFIKVADAFAAGAGNPQKSWLGPREDEYKYSKRRRVIICNPDAPGTITSTSTPLKKTSLLDQANAGPV